ncbi:MAG TPA: PDZ domain-containing protein, partial [Thermoanaerobaculia bacterium]|nr:PDZ domain-containing protein [Thermoanaerobaculia bacterium]
MTPRTRITVITLLTLTVIGAGFGYTIGRIHKWHQRGWAGMTFYPDLPGPQRGPQRMQAAPGGLMMIYAGSPADEHLRPGDRIVAVNGIPIGEIVRLRNLDEKTPDRALVRYTIARGGKQLVVPIRLGSPLRSPYIVLKTAVTFVVAILFVLVAVVVFQRRPDDRRATVFYAFALVSALALLASAATIYEHSGGRGVVPVVGLPSVRSLLFLILPIAYAPLILHLALIFPRERPILATHPRLIRWIYAAAAYAGLLVIALGLLMAFFFVDPTSKSAAFQLGFVLRRLSVFAAIGGLLIALQTVIAGRAEGLVERFATRPFRAVSTIVATYLSCVLLIGQHVSMKLAVAGAIGLVVIPVLLLCSYPVLAAIALVRSYRGAGVEEKRQVQWPLWGLMLGLGTRIVATLSAFGIGVVVMAQERSAVEFRALFETLDIIPTLTAALIPLSFAASILKYRLMNIDVIIRKTVVYAILSTAIVVIYLGVVGGLGSLLVTFAGVQNQTLVIASTLVVALMFIPVRNKLQTLVDRNLFRHRFDYPEALKEITTASRSASETTEFLATTAEKLQQALQNRAIVIFVERQDELVAVAKVGVSDTLLGRLRVPRSFIALLDRPFDPRRRTVPEDVSAALARVETVLVVPAGTRAFIAVAAKLSGGELDVEDVDFLRSAADQIENAMDRIRMQV